MVLIHIQMDVIDSHSVLDVFLGQATNLNAGVQADRLFLHGVGVAHRSLGAVRCGALCYPRTAAPKFFLNNSLN